MGVRAGQAVLTVVAVRVSDFTLDPTEIAYEQVADHIAALISAGVLPPGSMLANERSLAAEYGVAVGTARKAAQLLEQRGLIKIRRSKGKFVLTETERERLPDSEQV